MNSGQRVLEISALENKIALTGVAAAEGEARVAVSSRRNTRILRLGTHAMTPNRSSRARDDVGGFQISKASFHHLHIAKHTSYFWYLYAVEYISNCVCVMTIITTWAFSSEFVGPFSVHAFYADCLCIRVECDVRWSRMVSEYVIGFQRLSWRNTMHSNEEKKKIL